MNLKVKLLPLSRPFLINIKSIIINTRKKSKTTEILGYCDFFQNNCCNKLLGAENYE